MWAYILGIYPEIKYSYADFSLFSQLREKVKFCSREVEIKENEGIMNSPIKVDSIKSYGNLSKFINEIYTTFLLILHLPSIYGYFRLTYKHVIWQKANYDDG